MEYFCIFGTSQVQVFACLVQKTHAFQACPWSHSKNAAVHISQRRETVKRGIDPTVQGDVRRPSIRGGRISVAPKDLADRLPGRTAQLWIAMSTVDILCDEVPHDAANEDVGVEVLGGPNSRE